MRTPLELTYNYIHAKEWSWNGFATPLVNCPPVYAPVATPLFFCLIRGDQIPDHTPFQDISKSFLTAKPEVCSSRQPPNRLAFVVILQRMACPKRLRQDEVRE